MNPSVKMSHVTDNPIQHGDSLLNLCLLINYHGACQQSIFYIIPNIQASKYQQRIESEIASDSIK